MSTPILEIKNLSISFNGLVVVQINLSIQPNSFSAIVGQSGSGKTLTALSITKLLDANAVVRGEIWYDSQKQQKQDLIKCSDQEILKIRAAQIAIIFQDPSSALNPVMRVGDQVCEPYLIHRQGSKASAKDKAKTIFNELGLNDFERIFSSYPHELSGGMKQRIAIAMALMTDPKILIADEPTTALDALTQKEIMELLLRAKEKHKMTIIFITHNLRLAKKYSDEIHVIERGRVVETLVRDNNFVIKENYTQKLFKASLVGVSPKTLIEI